MHICHKCNAFIFSNGTKHVCALEYDTDQFSCPRCGNIYSNKNDVVRHLENHRSSCGRMYGASKKLYPCYQCKRRFVRARDIPRHIRESCPATKEKQDPAFYQVSFDVDEDDNVAYRSHKIRKTKKKVTAPQIYTCAPQADKEQ